MTNSYPVAWEHGRTRTAAESFLFQEQLVQFWVSMDVFEVVSKSIVSLEGVLRVSSNVL